MPWKKYKEPMIHKPDKQEKIILLGIVALSGLVLIVVWLVNSKMS